jgi:hypothetical protein
MGITIRVERPSHRVASATSYSLFRFEDRPLLPVFPFGQYAQSHFGSLFPFGHGSCRLGLLARSLRYDSLNAPHEGGSCRVGRNQDTVAARIL